MKYDVFLKPKQKSLDDMNFFEGFAFGFAAGCALMWKLRDIIRHRMWQKKYGRTFHTSPIDRFNNKSLFSGIPSVPVREVGVDLANGLDETVITVLKKVDQRDPTAGC